MWNSCHVFKAGRRQERENELVFTKGQWKSLSLSLTYLNDQCPYVGSCGSLSSWKVNITLRNAIRVYMSDKYEQSQHRDINSKYCLFCSVRRHYILINQLWWFLVMFSSWWWCRDYMCLATGYPKSRSVQETSQMKLHIPGLSAHSSLLLLWAYMGTSEEIRMCVN